MERTRGGKDIVEEMKEEGLKAEEEKPRVGGIEKFDRENSAGAHAHP
jgi:hypothetical protein